MHNINPCRKLGREGEGNDGKLQLNIVFNCTQPTKNRVHLARRALKSVKLLPSKTISAFTLELCRALFKGL